MRSTPPRRFLKLSYQGGRRAPGRQFNQKTLDRQIGCQFEGKRKIHFMPTDNAISAPIVLALRARKAPEHLKATGVAVAWILEVMPETLMGNAKRRVRRDLLFTSLWTRPPKVLLPLIRQRRSLDNEWHCARDAYLVDDTQC